MNRPAAHKPVMAREVLAVLAPRDGAIYVDGTFGAGGYSRALLENADCRVWGIDRDPSAIVAGTAVARDYAGRLTLRPGRFSRMDAILRADGIDGVDGVALDLGVSSMQLDEAERGFSFRHDAALDMRMEGVGASAADVVNDRDESELADILFHYGEERRSRRVARAIVEARRRQPITRTAQLADIVRRALGAKARAAKIDPATRTFQALRIYVNDELDELRRGLRAAERILRPRGRVAVVSFHSLEDRIVKSFLRRRAGGGAHPSRHAPLTADETDAAPPWSLIGRRVVKPGTDEIAANPRARSARLRAAERTDHPAWPDEGEDFPATGGAS